MEGLLVVVRRTSSRIALGGGTCQLAKISLFAPELFSDDFLMEKSQKFMIIIIVTCFTPLPPILDAFSRHSFLSF